MQTPMAPALLMLALAAPGGGPIPLEGLPPAALASRLFADAQVLRGAVDGAHRLVDVVLGRRDLFPLAGEPSDPALARQVWRSYLDHLLAVDGAAAWYGGAARLETAGQGLADQARLAALATRLARQALALALLDGLAGNPAVVRLLSRERTPDGVGVLDRLADKARAPGACAFVAPGYSAYRAVRRRLLARHAVRSAGVGWTLSYVERQARALRACGATGGPEAADGRWFPGGSRAAAWYYGLRVGQPEDTSLPRAVLDAVSARLRPGDVVLLRRTRFRDLTGWPGFWHTAVVFVGEPGALDASFAGDRQVAHFFRRRGIPDGRLSLYLARRFSDTWAKALPGGRPPGPPVAVGVGAEGVNLAPVADVLAGDALAVLRPRASRLVVARALARAFHYVGRRYDTEHDATDDRALDAGELIRTVFSPGDGREEGLAVPTEQVLGRAGVHPDALARQVDQDPEGGPWEVVAYAEGATASFGGDALEPVRSSLARDPWAW